MYLLYFFTAFLLSPKIDLIQFGGSALRAEDFIWLLALIFQVFRPGKHKFPLLPSYFRWFLLYIMVAVVSWFLNFKEFGLPGLFYILRQFQYCTWGIMAIASAATITRAEVERHLTFVGIVLALWGGLEALGLTPKIGKFAGAAGRISINTSGPFESSVLLAILGFSARNVILKSGLMILMVLTQARITLVGALVSAIAARPRLIAPALIASAVLVVALPFARPLFEGSRFVETKGPIQMAESLSFMWGAVPTFETRREFMVGAGYIDKEGGDYLSILYSRRGDLSFEIRAYRWSLIVKSWLQHPAQLFVGFSPGFFGQAVDGNFVRLIGESGLIGSAFFFAFISGLLRFRRDTLTWAAVSCMLVTAIFIDIFWSSKVMTLLWFVSSWELINRKSLASPIFASEYKGL